MQIRSVINNFFITFFTITFMLIIAMPVSFAEENWQLVLDDVMLEYIDANTIELHAINDNDVILTAWYLCYAKNPTPAQKNLSIVTKRSYKFLNKTDLQTKTIAKFGLENGEIITKNLTGTEWAKVNLNTVEAHIFLNL